jgi:RNA polymerase sigma-70 factor, ECF subfamily
LTSIPDEAARLLTKHGRHLHALLTRLTLRADVAEDLLQDLFCRLSENDRFAQATSPPAYAVRVATNLAFDHRRRQKRVQRAEAKSHKVVSNDLSPLVNAQRREDLDQVLDAIDRLPHASRHIVVMRYLERQDYQMIGQELGKSPHQVRALCHKAIRALRTLLDDEGTSNRVARSHQHE